MDREAIEEAIEVLEDARAEMLTETGNENYYGEAITALRQTLVDADDTSQERVDEIVKTEHDKQIEIALAYQRGWDAALAQQEPVAWITNGGKGELWWHRSSKFDEEGNLIGPNPDDIPLYTAPPKREWVGLTDDAVFELADTNLYDGGKNFGVLAFAKAIEADLKEKNHG
jgi:hypothetical protein